MNLYGAIPNLYANKMQEALSFPLHSLVLVSRIASFKIPGVEPNVDDKVAL